MFEEGTYAEQEFFSVSSKLAFALYWMVFCGITSTGHDFEGWAISCWIGPLSMV